MSKGIAIAVVGVVVLVVVWLLASSKDPAPIQQDTQPFDAAVQAYLKAKSFGMKPVRMEELNVDGDRATAAYKLKDAEGTYNLAVTWTFTFEKTDEGNWVARSHEAK